MYNRCLLQFGIAGLMMFGYQFGWAQVDTSEGGGEEFQRQEYEKPSETGDQGQVPKGESLRAQIARQETANIKEQMRLLELIDANRRKLIELENRIEALESLHEKKGELKTIAPAGPDSKPNGQGDSDADRAAFMRPGARPAAAAKNDLWRYRRFQGRWWYWTPDRHWVYWTGDRWIASASPQAARR